MSFWWLMENPDGKSMTWCYPRWCTPWFDVLGSGILWISKVKAIKIQLASHHKVGVSTHAHESINSWRSLVNGANPISNRWSFVIIIPIEIALFLEHKPFWKSHVAEVRTYRPERRPIAKGEKARTWSHRSIWVVQNSDRWRPIFNSFFAHVMGALAVIPSSRQPFTSVPWSRSNGLSLAFMSHHVSVNTRKFGEGTFHLEIWTRKNLCKECCFLYTVSAPRDQASPTSPFSTHTGQSIGVSHSATVTHSTRVGWWFNPSQTTQVYWKWSFRIMAEMISSGGSTYLLQCTGNQS